MEGMNMTSKIKPGEFVRIAVFMVVFLTLTAGAWADGEHPHPEHNLAKQSQNPVGSLISVPFENNATFNNGPEDVFVNILNIKPVIPTGITENFSLINRVIVPVIYQDDGFTGQWHHGHGGAPVSYTTPVRDLGSIFGLGDITYQGFFSPKKPGKFIWGLGPQLGIPTGMDRLTSNQWTLGPTAVGLTMPGHWVIGLLASNIWNIGGGYDNAPSVNALTAQYFINYNMKGGWYLSSAPVITANWEAEDNDDTWTIPFGGGVGRVFKIGKQPVNLKLAAYYSVEKPDNASDWNLQFSWTFLFPK
jgi:hypothetical protein